MQKNSQIRTLIKQLLAKNRIFKKSPQSLHSYLECDLMGQSNELKSPFCKTQYLPLYCTTSMDSMALPRGLTARSVFFFFFKWMSIFFLYNLRSLRLQIICRIGDMTEIVKFGGIAINNLLRFFFPHYNLILRIA